MAKITITREPVVQPPASITLTLNETEAAVLEQLLWKGQWPTLGQGHGAILNNISNPLRASMKNFGLRTLRD